MIPFVDTHVHCWDRTQIPYPWLEQFPAIGGRHGPAELHAEAGARFPSKILFVQGDCDRAYAFDEVRAAETLAETEPTIAGIVAFAPMDRGAETIAALDRLRARPLMRGVRHLIQGEDDPDFCRRPEFIAGVRAAGERGLSFDICVKHHQLASVIDLVRECPGTQFILDHAGKPDIRGRQLEPWREHIATLAWFPYVSCKLSGLVTEADPAAWTTDDLRPYADHLLARFGARRLMFGSDWPVVKLASPYQRWLDTALELLSPLPADERDAVMAGNAQRIYRLS
jgi:L-fuconolactonase